MTLALAGKINLALSALGAAVFAAILLYLTFAPQDFDQRVRGFAIAKVQKRFDQSLSKAADSETLNKISNLAGAISERLGQKVEQFRSDLRGGMDVFIADVLAAACKLDCERREQARLAVRSFYESSIARYGVALERVQNMVVDEYQSVMDELRGDLKIFAGSNFFALAFALALSVLRGQAARHLLPISLALTAATALAALWYAFGQDWVMAIIFGDYWGWAYAVFLLILSVLMIDIAANKARATSFLFNRVADVFGGALSLSPC